MDAQTRGRWCLKRVTVKCNVSHAVTHTFVNTGGRSLFAPAIMTLPPSMTVVSRDDMDFKERGWW